MKATAKLTADQVADLRRLYADDVPVMRLARLFGLGRANVRACALGLTYKDIPGACEPRPWPRDNRPAISAGRRAYVNMSAGMP